VASGCSAAPWVIGRRLKSVTGRRDTEFAASGRRAPATMTIPGRSGARRSNADVSIPGYPAHGHQRRQSDRSEVQLQRAVCTVPQRLQEYLDEQTSAKKDCSTWLRQVISSGLHKTGELASAPAFLERYLDLLEDAHISSTIAVAPRYLRRDRAAAPFRTCGSERITSWC
jgi:hypothetical protein